MPNTFGNRGPRTAAHWRTAAWSPRGASKPDSMESTERLAGIFDIAE
ncbi:uncharacterized protein HHUB_2078 [Halobacterium hubeiense]|uniref:Uncharacterized protein n=1 Tax=Halobacterium hubeiense TaxID=1407499 RepID=A0A0U5CXL1_9EURY|nr:uncharacterized protein HHUB_2078 [Halobacterium hubeiense]